MQHVLCKTGTPKQIKQDYLKQRIKVVKINLSASKKIAKHACGEQQQNVSIECHIMWNEVISTQTHLNKLYDELRKTHESWDVI